ncbi:hypothetical protein F5Y04DRAFT_276617 [Hypomontagnella monticulosa]|nr:hypothetical protein F5Y04DRAFT_276617 [Hypomontagnella monticulosa]
MADHHAANGAARGGRQTQGNHARRGGGNGQSNGQGRGRNYGHHRRHRDSHARRLSRDTPPANANVDVNVNGSTDGNWQAQNNYDHYGDEQMSIAYQEDYASGGQVNGSCPFQPALTEELLALQQSNLQAARNFAERCAEFVAMQEENAAAEVQWQEMLAEMENGSEANRQLQQRQFELNCIEFQQDMRALGLQHQEEELQQQRTKLQVLFQKARTVEDDEIHPDAVETTEMQAQFFYELLQYQANQKKELQEKIDAANQTIQELRTALQRTFQRTLDNGAAQETEPIAEE